MSEVQRTIKSQDDLMNIKWKTEPCMVGESCWCRCIVPAHDTTYSDGTEVFISASGELSKDVAEHFVRLHNTWLETKIVADNIL